MTPQLIRLHGPDPDPEAVPVALIVHNEANILPAFLDHYRSLCRATFLIVDDRSTDGTTALLAAQPDVTLFRPPEASNFAEHKEDWRSEVLDRWGAGRWCLCPDADEHFVFPGMGQSGLDDFIAALERAGAEAVVTLMVDMYADRSLKEHVFTGGDAAALRAAFPLFDAPGAGYWIRAIRRSKLKKFPTPPISYAGGARARIFYAGAQPGLLTRLVRNHVLDIEGPINTGALTARLRSAAYNWTFRNDRPGNKIKLGLIRWQRGFRFSDGAHAVNRKLPLTEAIAVFLHYPITRGVDGLNYIAQRGQHSQASRRYRRMLDTQEMLSRSPAFEGSRRYEGPHSLAGLMRGIS